LFIERGKDNTGADNADIYITAFYYTNVRYQQAFHSGSWGAAVADTGILAPADASTSGSINADLGIYTDPPGWGGAYLNAGLTHFGYFNADITALATFVMSIYGVSHTLLAVGGVANLITVSRGNLQANMRIAMLWE